MPHDGQTAPASPVLPDLTALTAAALPEVEALFVAGREALRARFLYSQSFSQDDPWAQRAEGAEAEHHAPMARFTPQKELA